MHFEFWWMSLIILFAYCAQAMSGFGAVVISIALGSFIFKINQLPPILAPLSALLSTYIFMRNSHDVQWKILFKRILPIMSFGMIIGFMIYKLFPCFDLKKPFAILIIFLSVIELSKLLVKKPLLVNELIMFLPPSMWTFFSGVVHGLYASGGPVLVYAISRMKMTKGAFRATLSIVWMFLNSILSVFYLFNRDINLQVGKQIVFYIPALTVGTFLGDILHNYVSEERFKMIVFVLLFMTGCISLLKNYLP